MEKSCCQPIGLVVCGGTALNALEIIERPTIDVDVVALAKDGPSLYRAEEFFSQDMMQCIQEVAQDFDLPEKWLNTGPRKIFEKPLPEGVEKRLSKEIFGSRLTIYWMGREDLICLKLYAASDDITRTRRNMDIDDLKNIAPSQEELEKAIEWLKDTSPFQFEEMKPALDEVLTDLGHGNLGYYI